MDRKKPKMLRTELYTNALVKVNVYNNSSLNTITQTRCTAGWEWKGWWVNFILSSSYRILLLQIYLIVVLYSSLVGKIILSCRTLQWNRTSTNAALFTNPPPKERTLFYMFTTRMCWYKNSFNWLNFRRIIVIAATYNSLYVHAK